MVEEVDEVEEEEVELVEAVEIQSRPPSRHNSGHSRGRTGRHQEEVSQKYNSVFFLVST